MRNLKTFISETDISQAKLAEKLGISRSHMSLLVNGERKPGRDLAIAIERATDGAVPVYCWETAAQGAA